jgi:acetyl-CoA C-acetyltransferase
VEARDPRTPVVVAARRSAVTTAGRALAGSDAAALAAPVLAALRDDLVMAHLALPTRGVDDVLLGNCCGPGGDVGRVAALAAGLGDSVPGATVDRQCGSGLEAVRLAAALVRAGDADVVLAGGTESATHARDGGARAAFAPPGHPDPDMGIAAEDLAAKAGIERERQDAYAARSHRLTAAAAADGIFDPELVAVDGCSRDDRPRARLGVPVLARMPAAFVPGGTVTAGNSCGINDGAAAVAVVPEALRSAAGLPGLRLMATVAVGVDPALPGLGPVPAIRAVLRRAAIPLRQIDVVEITEAFAAQILACTDALGLDPLGPDASRVCPDGGAIALGHPWGASGALLVVRLFSRLVRRRLGSYGVAACAVGGGQGVAILVEAVAE